MEKLRRKLHCGRLSGRLMCHQTNSTSMEKQVRCIVSSESPGVSRALDIFEISRMLDCYLQMQIDRVNAADLRGWRLLIYVVIRNTDSIGVFRRTTRYSSDMEFEVSISIPVPGVEDAEYGLSEMGFFNRMDETRFHMIAPQYAAYQGLRDYFVSSGERAIDKAFEVGFKCGGKVIRYVA